MPSTLLLLASLALAQPPANEPQMDPARRPNREPIDVVNRKQLFLDGMFLKSSRGVELTVNSPVDVGQAIKADRPWEKGGIDSYHTIVPDPRAGHVKMYYMCYVKQPGGDEYSRHHLLACAISKDGIHWEKPRLGIHEFEGSRDNNLVMVAATDGNQPTYHELGNVVIDPNDDPARRYKILYVSNPPGIHGAYSADGFHWSAGQRITRAKADSQKVFLWDDSIHRWVGYFRYWNATRRVTRIETDDFGPGRSCIVKTSCGRLIR